MLSYTRALVLLSMTLCVTAPILYADEQPSKPYYVVGHGVIVKQFAKPTTPQKKEACSEQCSTPNSNGRALG